METNRRLAFPIGTGCLFERAVHAQTCFFSGGRSAR